MTTMRGGERERGATQLTRLVRFSIGFRKRTSRLRLAIMIIQMMRRMTTTATMMMMMMMSHMREETRSRSQLTLVCCQNEEIGPTDGNLEGKEYFIERMKQRSKTVLIQRAIAAKIW